MTNLAVVISHLGGIDEHLERLNSKVATQAGQINTIQLWKAKLEGAGMVFDGAWVLIISMLSGCAVLIWTWLTRK